LLRSLRLRALRLLWLLCLLWLLWLPCPVRSVAVMIDGALL